MKYAYCLLACLPLAAFALTDWVPFAVDERVRVQVPAAPTEVDLAKLPAATAAQLQNTRIWTARDADGVYQILRFARVTEQSQDTAGRRSYYLGVISGVMRSEQGELLARSFFPTAAGDGLEIKYRGLHRGTGKRVIKYNRSLVVGTVGYAFTFVPFDKQDSLGLTGSAQRRRFFESITAKP